MHMSRTSYSLVCCGAKIEYLIKMEQLGIYEISEIKSINLSRQCNVLLVINDFERSKKTGILFESLDILIAKTIKHEFNCHTHKYVINLFICSVSGLIIITNRTLHHYLLYNLDHISIALRGEVSLKKQLKLLLMSLAI